MISNYLQTYTVAFNIRHHNFTTEDINTPNQPAKALCTNPLALSDNSIRKASALPRSDIFPQVFLKISTIFTSSPSSLSNLSN